MSTLGEGQIGKRAAELVVEDPDRVRVGIHGARVRGVPHQGCRVLEALERKREELQLLKKDTQRAAELRVFELPRDGAALPLEADVELTSGHELVFLPLVPDWNNATTVTMENLSIEKAK